MKESNHRSPLLEEILRPGDSNARDPADINNKLCDVIRETSFEIHKFFRGGHLEKIYENALAHRLSKIEHGLLINFGAQKLQVKKYILSRDT